MAVQGPPIPISVVWPHLSFVWPVLLASPQLLTILFARGLNCTLPRCFLFYFFPIMSTPGPIRTHSGTPTSVMRTAHPYLRTDGLSSSPSLNGGARDLPSTSNPHYGTPLSGRGSPVTSSGDIENQYPLPTPVSLPGTLSQQRTGMNTFGRSSHFAAVAPASNVSTLNAVEVDLLIAQHGQDELRNYIHTLSAVRA